MCTDWHKNIEGQWWVWHRLFPTTDTDDSSDVDDSSENTCDSFDSDIEESDSESITDEKFDDEQIDK